MKKGYTGIPVLPTMFRLYGFGHSGNCLKIQMTLTVLKLPYENIVLDPTDPVLRELNPLGKVPILVTPAGAVLTESLAILYYLAQGTALWPEDGLKAYQVLRWLSFEQAEIQQTIDRARYARKFGLGQEGYGNTQSPTRALEIMEDHLQENDYLVGGLTIADIALYAYLSYEAGICLTAYPRIRTWLKVVKGGGKGGGSRQVRQVSNKRHYIRL